jgi:MFS transporter, OPA family, glycerol-3-phosphate transporter
MTDVPEVGGEALSRWGRRTIGPKYGTVMALALGYVGVYLCRSNLSVALPMLQDSLHASKESVGIIASAGSFAYAAGKFASGAAVDRLGGKHGFLVALFGVALFGATAGAAPGIAALAAIYAATRFFGAGGWNAMMKVTASWFPAGRLAPVIALLSQSFILGAIVAKLLATEIAATTHDWRAVMAMPSVVLLILAVACVMLVREGPLRPREDQAEPRSKSADLLGVVGRLFGQPQYLAICVMSFTLTLVREAFGTWSVDFLRGLQAGPGALGAAALKSVGYEVAGGVSVLVFGLVFDRISPRLRRVVVFSILLLLAVVIAALAEIGRIGPAAAPYLIAAVGLLMFPAYSIVGGVVAVECGGTRDTGTAVGIVDGIGYLASILAGQAMGSILDRAGYGLAFYILAGLSLVAGVAALGLRPAAEAPADAGAA